MYIIQCMSVYMHTCMHIFLFPGISCIQFDDTRIVSGSWDKTIKVSQGRKLTCTPPWLAWMDWWQVWNRRTNTVWAALTLAGHSGTVRCLHLHNNRLVSGSSDRTIKVSMWRAPYACCALCGWMLQVWDLATDKVGWVGAACRATMVGHMHTVRCLQVSRQILCTPEWSSYVCTTLFSTRLMMRKLSVDPTTKL